ERWLVILGRITGPLCRAGNLARYVGQKGIWASSWPNPEQ
ncbi:hypothetical protein A2U01_0098829, partial [Trifolium medium]|nr:hypothetical protein [Trifolium medium]